MNSTLDCDRERSPSLLVVGLSPSHVCGVRDHALLLSNELKDAGMEVKTAWQDGRSSTKALISLAKDIERLASRGSPAPVVLLHYSVFAFAWHGIPFMVPWLAWWLARRDISVVLFAHEYAYPFGRRGVRGLVQAVTQRAALVPLIAASSAVIVTTDDRARWFRSRWWLPNRPTACAPVFSNIGPHPSAGDVAAVPGRIGVFSFGAEGLEIGLVTSAVAEVAKQAPGAHLVLIGAPGSDSTAGREWRVAAEAAGCPVSFTGVVEEAEVSRQIAACQIMVFPDPAGPSSRKTSLAAALVHGKAVVALDGPQRWGALVDAAGVVLAEPDIGSVSRHITHLLKDEAARLDVGSRAAAFAADLLTPAATAGTVFDIVNQMASRETDRRTPGWLHRCALPNPVGGPGRFHPWVAGGGAVMKRTFRVPAVEESLEPALHVAAEVDGRPRVALVAHDIHDRGGMERACAELIRNCHDEFSFTVVAIELAPELRPLVDRWVRIRVPTRPFPAKFVTFWLRAGLALRRLDVDLIHTVGAIAPGRADVITVFHCHAGQRDAVGSFTLPTLPPLRSVNTTVSRWLSLWVERSTYRPGKVRVLVCSTPSLSAEVSGYYPSIDTAVVPNGVVATEHLPNTPDSSREKLRAINGVAATTVVVLFLGGDWHRKGLPLILEALSLVGDSKDIALWVVGRGDRTEVERRASVLGIAGRVAVVGPVDDVERYYRAADIFVLASSYETFSIPCFEAAANGVPIIATSVHGVRDLIGNNEAGILVEGTAGSIAAALERLSGDPEMRSVLGAEGRRRSAAFTWEAAAGSVSDLYRSLLAEERL